MISLDPTSRFEGSDEPSSNNNEGFTVWESSKSVEVIGVVSDEVA